MVREKQLSRGFTLVELLVVIAILAILVSLLFPVFRSAKERAERQSCISNMRVIAQAIQAYHQDHLVFPSPSGYTSLHGIPDGGITGLELTGTPLSHNDLWCSQDTYPDRMMPGLDPVPARDGMDSTYNFGYNYYGYVTDTDGTPFPVTTLLAAQYLFGNPQTQDPTIPAGSKLLNWDLKLLTTQILSDGSTGYSASGLFQGLWNHRAPAETPITFCPHHPQGRGDNFLQLITLSGAVINVEPTKPRTGAGGATDRKPASDGSNAHPPIDWRINQAPFPMGGSKDASLFGDSEGNTAASSMPLVETTYRQFKAQDVMNLPLSSATTGNNYYFYDTGITLQQGDLVMIVAHARWAWGANSRTAIENGSPMGVDKAGYMTLYDSTDHLWCTADGDPVEGMNAPANRAKNYSTMLVPTSPHCQLVGYVRDPTLTTPVDNTMTFGIGNRGSHLVTAADLNGATSANLLLTMNDTSGTGDFADNVGWCETWIAICHPKIAQ